MAVFRLLFTGFIGAFQGTFEAQKPFFGLLSCLCVCSPLALPTPGVCYCILRVSTSAHRDCTANPCAWIVTSKVFPLNMRAKDISLGVVSRRVSLTWSHGHGCVYKLNKNKPLVITATSPFSRLATLCIRILRMHRNHSDVIDHFLFFFETKDRTLEEVKEISG